MLDVVVELLGAVLHAQLPGWDYADAYDVVLDGAGPESALTATSNSPSVVAYSESSPTAGTEGISVTAAMGT